MENKDTVDNLSDEDLVALILKDQNYFIHIVDRYKVRLFSYVRRLSNINAEDAEDLLQDIFLKAYLNLNSFDSGLKFSSWLYSVAHNQVVSNYRKRKSRPEGHLIDLETEATRNLLAQVDLIKDVDDKLLVARVSEVLSDLEAKYREVLILKYLEEKNYQEISDIIRKPLGTVASLLSKAKLEFKQALKSKS